VHRNSKTFEQRLLLLQKRIKIIPLSVSKLIYMLSGKGRILAAIVLSFPFCQPIHIPFLSTPLGLAIALIGLRVAFGKRIWLPKKILSKKISRKTFSKITDQALWLVQKMKPWVHPRILWLSSMNRTNGLLICINGIILALPLPIPFFTLPYAWSIFLIGLGMLENDGVLILLGYAMFLIGCGVLVLLALGIHQI